MVRKRVAAVQVEGRADPLGHGPYRDPFTVQLAVLVVKIMHGLLDQGNRVAVLFYVL
jgi:hypothetical protein